MNGGLKLALFMVFLIFIVSACANYQNPFQKKEKEELGRGLKIAFAQNTIPDVIYVDQEFPLFVEIENYGPEISGSIRIYDQLENSEVDFSETLSIPQANFVEDNKGNVIGKIVPGRITFPREGSDRRVSYKKDNVFDGARANIHTELLVENYPVNEKFPLCIKEEDVQGVPCSNNEIETFNDARSQYRAITYSPVTIERVEKTATPLGNSDYFLSLDITLSNVGGGEIVSGVSTDAEPNPVVREGAVKIQTVSFGGQALRCSPQDEVIFVNNKGVLNCVGTAKLQQGQEYVERITQIEYSFNYKMKIKKGPIPIVERN